MGRGSDTEGYFPKHWGVPWFVIIGAGLVAGAFLFVIVAHLDDMMYFGWDKERANRARQRDLVWVGAIGGIVLAATVAIEAVRSRHRKKMV